MNDYPEIRLLIDGQWLAAGERATQPAINPATGEVLGQVPHATAADLDRALAAADRAFAGWRNTTAYDRRRILGRAADLLRARVEEIALLTTLEQGKPLADARIDVATAADMFEWFAEEGRRAYGRLIPPREPGRRMMVTLEPVGPVAAFAPWNVPAITLSRKVGAALAAGCPVIYKPSEETPATALAVARILVEAGVPSGVLQVVLGDPDMISRHLMASPIIRKVTFTGSTPVGQHLARLAADNLQRLTMELGGHAPVLVFDDVDVEATVRGAVATKYRNAGQICTAPTRFLVQDAIAGRFTEAFAAAARALKVGDGRDPASEMGPCANPRRVEAMSRMVADAEARGGRIVTGGKRIGNAGSFFEPTVITDLPDDALAMTTEPFGPLAIIRSFSTLDEAVGVANSLRYGLAGYVHSTSARRIADACDGLNVGCIAVNNWQVSAPETPFGGVGDSGYGSEGGLEGLQAYLAIKFIHQA